MFNNENLWVRTGQLGTASRVAYEKLPEGEKAEIDELIQQVIVGLDKRAGEQRTNAIVSGNKALPSGKVPFGEGSARELLAAIGKRAIELDAGVDK